MRSSKITTPPTLPVRIENKPAPSRFSLVVDTIKGLPSTIRETLFPTSLLPQDPALKMRRLENGLTYYVRKNAYPFPGKVSFQLVVKAGKCDEREKEKGIAHLVEHITSIETKHFKKDEIFHYLNSKGVKWIKDSNAYTTDEKTFYKLDLSTADSATLEKGLFILSEVGSNATLSDEIIEHERGIVIDELKLRQSPLLRYLWERVRILCDGTPYPSLLDRNKEIESVRTCPAETVRDFYKHWYRPENMAVIAVGDFDPNRISQMIEKHFGKISSSKIPLERQDIQLKTDGGTKILCVAHPEISHSSVEIHYQLPEVKHRGIVEREKIEKNLGIQLFKEMFNQRLSDLAEESNSPFVRARSSSHDTIPNWPAFTLSAQAKEGQLPLTLRQMLIEIKRLKIFGFTLKEFERAKKVLLANVDSVILEKGKTDSSAYIQNYHSHFMHNVPVPDYEARIALARKILEKVDLKNVNALSSSLFSSENCLISTASPKKEGVERVTPEHLKKEIAHVAKERPARHADEAVRESLLETLPSPVKVEAIRQHEKIGATEYILKNGLRVFVKPTTYENDTVSLMAISERGTRDAHPSDHASALFSVNFFNHCGLGTLDHKALGKLLQTKVMNINSSMGSYMTSINASSTVRDFETVLQYAHLLFTRPLYDQVAFEKAMKKMEEDLINAGKNPDVRFMREWIGAVTQRHPEMEPLEHADLKKIDYETCKNFHRALYSNPADYTMVIVGNLQSQKAKELIERYLATIPGEGKKSPRREIPPIPFPSGISVKEVAVGSQTGSLSYIAFPAPIQDTLRERCLSTWVCALLESRLNKKLRREMGNTYAQSCSFIHPEVRGLNPANPSKSLVAITGDPSHLKALDARAIEEIRDLQANGPTEEELEHLKKEKRKAYFDGRNTNAGWMQILISNCQWNAKQDDYDAMLIDKELKLLTRASARDHFKKIFPLSNYCILHKVPK